MSRFSLEVFGSSCAEINRLSLPPLRPSATALVVVDMQQKLVAQGPPACQADLGWARLPGLIWRLRLILLAARAAGLRIVHTRSGPAIGFDFIDALRPAPSETVLDRPGEGEFQAGGLETLLAQWGVSTVLLCGQALDGAFEPSASAASGSERTCWRVRDASVGLKLPGRPSAEATEAPGAACEWQVNTAEVLAAINSGGAAAQR
jgi:nicotinamidase-related amidase